ncbi:MAG: hypothetical protein Ct9H90mP22_0660 [Gammaproteobacteria bacterium]|nr:MAG: hypothetical protein Ct9H90mP22_0660 [Gammaproteobacteria bacterium]
MQAHAGAKFSGEEYNFSGGLHGLVFLLLMLYQKI